MHQNIFAYDGKVGDEGCDINGMRRYYNNSISK